VILTRLDALAAFHMHTPKWAVSPLSGAGAATHGGRANRPGVPALYLALEVETAVREYQQVSSLLPPGTLVSYQITLEKVVDFRSGYDAASWPSLWEDFHDDWRSQWFDERIEPPSWVIGDEVIALGAAGILFRSAVAAGGTNLVVYPERLAPTDTLTVYDPGQALPKNQDSWT
jgi:RES domain-containing protein